MTLTQTTTHEAEAQSRFVQQFKAQPDLASWLAAYVEQVQDLEDVLFELLLDRTIETSVGTQLDGLGSIVGEERLGKNDAAYRLWIRARVLVNKGSGTGPQLIEILDLLTANTFEYRPSYPAGFSMLVDDIMTLPAEVALILGEAAAAGVDACLHYADVLDTGAFTFASGDAVELSSSWTERANPKNVVLRAPAYYGGLWVAVGGNDVPDAYIVTSPDGINWTERANPANAYTNSVAHNGVDLWVAVGVTTGSGYAWIITSPDGINWTQRVNPKNFNLYSVAHNGVDLWTAVGAADGADAYIVTSPDGINWTERANPKNFDLYSVAHNGVDLWTAVGAADGADAYIVTSPDGINWTERAPTVAFNLPLSGVAHDGSGLWVAVGSAGAGAMSYIITSPDGTVWTQRTSPKNVRLRAVAHDGVGLWVAGGHADGVDSFILASDNGIDWAERPNPKNFRLYGVRYGGGLWVACGNPDGTDAYLLTSPNPIAAQGFSDDTGLTDGKWADAEEIA